MWQAGLLATATALVLGGLIGLGHYAREQIRDGERYQLAFTDIDCQPPPGMERGEFLDEVLYHARCPERFSILEDGLADRLRRDFAQHPWVAQVDKVEVRPPHTVRVNLTYRQAVLAVVVPAELAGVRHPTKLPIRGIDAQGVLLPKKAPIATALPVLKEAPRPAAPAGQAWGEARIEAAAHTAALLLPHQPTLRLTWMTLAPQGLVLWGPGFKVLWGQSNAAGEAAAEVKLERLLQARAAPEPSPGWWMVELDVRPMQGMQKRWVPLASP
jgi:hypothetical protein